MVTSRKPPRIFVSHSHKDNDFGARLIADLRAAAGDDAAIWYDASGGLHGGDAWWRKVVAELSARSIFIVILSLDAMASPWVNDEIDLAWKQKNSPEGKVILPVLHRPCQVREDLQTRQIISFVPPKAYDTALAELLTALGLPAPAPRPAPASAPASVPDPAALVAPQPYMPIVSSAPATMPPAADVAHTPSPAFADDDLVAREPIHSPCMSARSAPTSPEQAPRHHTSPPDSATAVRPGVSRRDFLRQGGIATGVGLAALAGAGLLAHAAGFGQSSARPGSTGRQPTPSPTQLPTVNNPKWHYRLPSGSTILGSPLVASGVLYIGAATSDGTLYALDANDGHQVWRRRLVDAIATAHGKPVSSISANIATAPVLAAPGILCVSANGSLLGLDISSGRVVWQVDYFFQLSSGNQDAAPVASSGAVYLLYLFGLLKYGAAAGTRLRTDDMIIQSGTTYTPSTNTYLPAISGEYIYGIATFSPDWQVQQYKLTGGNPTWTYHIGANLTSPIADNGTIYIGASDGNVYALKPPASKALWIYPAKAGNGLAPPIGQSPAYTNGVVYAAAGSTLHAVDATSGKAKWQTPIGALALSAPVVAGGIVYVGGSDFIYAFDGVKGTPVRRFAITGSGGPSPMLVVANKTLYVATYDGTVYAFSL